MSPCPHCEAPTETLLFCAACGRLLDPGDSPDPFAILGLEPAATVDEARLRKTLLSLQRSMHPDFFAGAEPAERDLADRNTAELNAAFELLADDFRRADWLVKSRGGPDENAERQMPQAFLMEVMEWNEALEEARDSEPGSPERAAADELQGTLEGERESLTDEIEKLLTPLPSEGDAVLTDVRQKLNAIRYIDRALGQIEEIRLDGAARR